MTDLEIRARGTGLVWENNPVLIQLLGLSPVLAVSSNLAYGIGLGVSTLFVCILSCFTVSMVRTYIATKWRLVWFMVILASYATVLETLAQLYFYPLSLRVGIYFPLICCNAAILVRMETVAMKTYPLEATYDALKTGLGFLFALVLLSACRELLISGSLFSNWQILLPANSASMVLGGDSSAHFFRFANTQAGVFILLGMLVALLNLIPSFGRGTEENQADVVPAKRARVTGRLIRDDSQDVT